MADFLTGIAFFLIIEGLVYALAPSVLKRMAEMLPQIPEGQLRVSGLVAVALIAQPFVQLVSTKDSDTARFLSVISAAATETIAVAEKNEWLVPGDKAGLARLLLCVLEGEAELLRHREELKKRFALARHPQLEAIFKAAKAKHRELILLAFAAGDPERNETAARAAFLDHIDVPAANIHPIAASDAGRSHDEAAADYAAELASFAAEDQPWPRFTLAFLGVGPDGHIASLFPDRSEISDTEHAVLPVRHSPVPPSERITLTRPVINSSRRVWLVLPGTDKASALGLALAGASYHSVPAAGAKGRKQTVFFVDEAAAQGVPEELIDPEF